MNVRIHLGKLFLFFFLQCDRQKLFICSSALKWLIRCSPLWQLWYHWIGHTRHHHIRVPEHGRFWWKNIVKGWWLRTVLVHWKFRYVGRWQCWYPTLLYSYVWVTLNLSHISSFPRTVISKPFRCLSKTLRSA